MFDSVIAWFTPERRARLAFPLEIALGGWLALATLLNQQWWGGTVHGAINAGIAGALGLGVAMHRVRPLVALAGLLAGCAGTFLTLIIGSTPNNGFAFLAAAVVLFGSAAYGSPVARWMGFAVSVLFAVTFFVAFVMGTSTDSIVSSGFLVSIGWWLLTGVVLALLPWLLGELVRSIRNRRALSTQVATVSTQRDDALTRADLEAERTRVARDVHDIVAHSLTVVIAQADGARYATAGDSPAASDAFETIAQTARDALADVRVLLTELRHTQEAGPQPGLDDLDALLATMRDSGLEFELREFGERGRLTDSRGLALYHIVQESLTNALRHGRGEAVVDLEWGEAAVDLVVTNAAKAGDGAAPEGAAVEVAATAPPRVGHGIDGMRERASLAGGELTVHDGAVFRVRARLPLEPRQASPSTPASAPPAPSAGAARPPGPDVVEPGAVEPAEALA